MNKLMLTLAVGASALAAIWAGGAAEADDPRFRFADCSVEFTVQNERFVAVDGRSWAEVDPLGECHETAENDDPPADTDTGGAEGDGSRSAPAGSTPGEADQQDDSEDEAGSADGQSEPTSPADSPVGIADDPTPQAQQQQNDAFPDCRNAVKPETGRALIRFVDNRDCVIVRDGGAVQVSRGGYTLNVTLPAGRDWKAHSFNHALVGDLFGFVEASVPYIFATVNLNAADGAVLRRSVGDCENEYFYEGERVHIVEKFRSWDEHGTLVRAGWRTADGTVHQGFPPDGVLVCPSALADAIIASVTVPAATPE